jgi:hypothetical protein
MSKMIRSRRALFLVAALAGTWAIAAALTGGFSFPLGGIRLSSRDPVNIGMFALASALAASVISQRNKAIDARHKDPWFDLSVIVAIAGVFLVIYQWSAARPLWLDEEMIALNVRDRPIGDLAGHLWLEQTAPLGWLVAERLMLLIFGTGELALRFIPAAFGIATVICAFWIGRRWMTPIGATIIVLLCSFGQWISFYSVELKHYSADTFWGLFLPALAIWTTDTDEDALQRRRLAIWWAAAAIGQWLSVGALLVTPTCAAVLLVVLFRRRGSGAAISVAMGGAVWVLFFALHYLLAIRYALRSQYFKEFWAFAFPPSAAGVAGTLRWLWIQLQPFAMKPGGTGLWMIFWSSAALGFIVVYSNSTPHSPFL